MNKLVQAFSSHDWVEGYELPWCEKCGHDKISAHIWGDENWTKNPLFCTSTTNEKTPKYRGKRQTPQEEPEMRSKPSIKYFLRWVKFILLPIHERVSSDDWGEILNVGNCVMYGLKKRLIVEKFHDNWPNPYIPTFRFCRYTMFREYDLLQ